MGTGNYGNVGGTVANIRSNYGLTNGGLIGEPGRSRGVRVIRSDDPEKTATEFFDDITTDAKSIVDFKQNGGIKGLVAFFSDGSRINLRFKSKSGGPAADIAIVKFEGIKSQKVHFIKKGKKD